MSGLGYGLSTSRSDSPDGVRKQSTLAPGQRLRLCTLQGSGRIVRFWMTLPLVGQKRILKEAVLRMYWDGEREPSVEVPLGDFFGASFGRPGRLISDRLVIAGGGYVCRFEMPFNDGAIIELENQSRQTLRDLFFQIAHHGEPSRREPEATFHARFVRENPTRQGKPFTILKARGKGWFAGVKIDIQNRSWWLKPPLKAIVLPRGFGLGLLEGWETVTIDGAEPIAGTGAEDYFGGGFYFKGGPFCTPTHGCTLRCFVCGRVSAYRFHIDDPLHFERSFEMSIDHGLENSMVGDYTAVAYWYQSEPHEPFIDLPALHERYVRAAWQNLLQWALVALLTLGMGLLVWVLMP